MEGGGGGQREKEGHDEGSDTFLRLMLEPRGKPSLTWVRAPAAPNF